MTLVVLGDHAVFSGNNFFGFLPFQASAKVILFPLPVPFPMKEYFPSQLFKKLSNVLDKVKNERLWSFNYGRGGQNLT